MFSMLKYMAIMAVFYLLSDKVTKGNYAKPVQTFSDMALYTLVFIMGMRIGANEEVVSRLGSVGLQALATTFDRRTCENDISLLRSPSGRKWA